MRYVCCHTSGLKILLLLLPRQPWMLGRWGVFAAVLLGLLCGFETATATSTDPHAIFQRMATAYDGIHDYTALFLKRVRVNGTLQPLEKIELRFQAPFKVYMAWREPHAGRVIVYVEGEHNNKVLVNPGGLLRFMRLSLDPTSPMITRHTHYTILQAGLRNTIDLLMKQYRRGTQAGQLTLHFRGHGEVDGRPTYHLEFICHADQTAGCYGSRGEVWIDQEHVLPIKLHIYDWDNQLYEHYEYHRLRLNPGLGPDAFRLAPGVTVDVPTAAAEENRSD